MDLRNLRLDLPLKDIKSANVDSIGQLLQGFFDFYAYRFRSLHGVVTVDRVCGDWLIYCLCMQCHADRVSFLLGDV